MVMANTTRGAAGVIRATIVDSAQPIPNGAANPNPISAKEMGQLILYRSKMFIGV